MNTTVEYAGDRGTIKEDSRGHAADTGFSSNNASASS